MRDEFFLIIPSIRDEFNYFYPSMRDFFACIYECDTFLAVCATLHSVGEQPSFVLKIR